jgi:hypothetical protein
MLGIINNPYYTHRNILLKELKNLSDNSLILEIGIGHGSSKLLHNHAMKHPSNKYLAFETNNEYLKVISNKYKLPNYEFKKVVSYDKQSINPNQQDIHLAFIDQSPWDSRIDIMLDLAPFTEIFILHDFDYYVKKDLNNKWNLGYFIELFPGFLFEIHDKLYPSTLVLKKSHHNLNRV